MSFKTPIKWDELGPHVRWVDESKRHWSLMKIDNRHGLLFPRVEVATADDIVMALVRDPELSRAVVAKLEAALK